VSGCLVLVPYLTHIEPDCDRALRELEKRGMTVRRYPATAAIDRTRSDAATRALDEGWDELFWIDSDIAFEPDSVEKLRAHDAPIVSGLYAKKGMQDFAVSLLPGTRELKVGEGGGLVEVRGVGLGFLRTRRAVFEDIRRHYSLPICNTRFGEATIPFFLPMVVAEEAGHWYLGEDYAFCTRARAAGHKILVDTRPRLGHIGRYTYGWEDAGEARKRAPAATFKFDAPVK
jgi:hypothetical protein